MRLNLAMCYQWTYFFSKPLIKVVHRVSYELTLIRHLGGGVTEG